MVLEAVISPCDAVEFRLKCVTMMIFWCNIIDQVLAASAFDETLGALENVAAILRAAGSAPERIVVATMLLTDKQDYAECNRAYVQFFAERGLARRLPARSTAMWAVPTTAKVAFSVVATVGVAEGKRTDSDIRGH